MRSHRAEVLELMQIVHRMPFDVAEYFVADMDDIEIERRFQMYTGMELSAAGRTTNSDPDFYPVFGLTTAAARSAAFNSLPEVVSEWPAEPGGKNRESVYRLKSRGTERVLTSLLDTSL